MLEGSCTASVSTAVTVFEREENVGRIETCQLTAAVSEFGTYCLPAAPDLVLTFIARAFVWHNSTRAKEGESLGSIPMTAFQMR